MESWTGVEWMDTPYADMTTRAPAVLIKAVQLPHLKHLYLVRVLLVNRSFFTPNSIIANPWQSFTRDLGLIQYLILILFFLLNPQWGCCWCFHCRCFCYSCCFVSILMLNFWRSTNHTIGTKLFQSPMQVIEANSMSMGVIGTRWPEIWSSG